MGRVKKELVCVPDISPVNEYTIVLQEEHKKFPNKFWASKEGKNNAAICTRYMIENLLKWSEKDVCEKLSVQTFIDCKLRGMLAQQFKGSPYAAIANAYPGKYKPWMLACVPAQTWDQFTGIDATRWLFDDVLGWTIEEIKEKVSYKTFEQYGLLNMVHTVFSGSVQSAVGLSYPDQIKFWEFKNLGQSGMWNDRTAIEATQWLIRDVLKWDKKQVGENITPGTFKAYDLFNMLQRVYNGSAVSAIMAAYPGGYSISDFKKTTIQNYWTLETAGAELRNIVENKLKLTPDEFKQQMGTDFVQKHGLRRPLLTLFDGNNFKMIDNAYPGRFKPWEFKVVTRNYWNDETTAEAIRWLVEDKLQWTEQQVRENYTTKVLSCYGLKGMVTTYYNDSPYLALNNAYPGKYFPWELKRVPQNYWNDDTIRQAVKDLIEHKLKWTDAQVRRNMSVKLLTQYGLGGVLRRYFKGNVTLLLEHAYPGKFSGCKLVG